MGSGLVRKNCVFCEQTTTPNYRSEIKPDFYRSPTNGLKQRLAEHDAGKCAPMAEFKPWKVNFYAAFETLTLAQRFEKYLKSGSGHEFAKRHLI